MLDALMNTLSVVVPVSPWFVLAVVSISIVIIGGVLMSFGEVSFADLYYALFVTGVAAVVAFLTRGVTWDWWTFEAIPPQTACTFATFIVLLGPVALLAVANSTVSAVQRLAKSA